MKIFVYFLFIFMFMTFSYSETTKDKIEATSSDIKSTKAQSLKLSKKIDEIGDTIVKEQKELKSTNEKISKITGLVLNLSQKFKDEEEELANLKLQNQDLLKEQKNLEEKITALIVNDFAFDLLQNDDLKTNDSIILNEIFYNLNDILQENLKKLLNQYQNTQVGIKDKTNKIDKIEDSIKEYKDKKTELSMAKKKQEILVANLHKNKENYIVQLQKLQKESEELRNTLEKLKIIDDEERKAKALAAQKKRIQKEKNIDDEESEEIASDPRIKDIDKKVKRYGSSYQASRVKKYSGKKTISPLKNGYVKRKFGDYTDPVYKIKIFNESIILASKEMNAQVYNVLPGKVIFAKETPVLDKVIIMENADRIHTIYAHLKQIAPTIKVGSVIKAGYAIGRIEEDLTFEVTQENYHINPLELIKLK